MSILHNSYENETCYLVCCGPSVEIIQDIELRARLSDKLVIAVKQSYLLLQGIADFHIYNLYNFQPYMYIDPKPVVIATEQVSRRKPDDLYSDICLNLIHGGNYGKSLAVTGCFDDFRLTNTLERCFGPGIVYELGFYLAEFLGVSKIITIGFDEGGAEHFYDGKGLQTIPESYRTEYSQYETDVAIQAVSGWFEWLKGKGIAWQRAHSDHRTEMGHVPTTVL